MHTLNELNGHLRSAAQQGHHHLIIQLLAEGAQINAYNHHGQTALIFATIHNALETVQQLLAQNAAINQADFEGQTALMYAATLGHSEVLHCLLEAGALVNECNHQGQTPLMLAAIFGRYAIVQHLLNQNAHLDARDHQGQTALMKATNCGHNDIIAMLLQHKADINISDNTGETVLHISAQRRWDHLSEQFIRQGARFEGMDIQNLPPSGGSDFSDNIAQGHLTQAKLLYDADRSLLNRPNHFGQTPLMRAAICGQQNAIDWLIDQHADVNINSENGLTALYFATRAFITYQHAEPHLQARYRHNLITIFSNCETLDDQTQTLIDNDETGTLAELFNPSVFTLK